MGEARTHTAEDVWRAFGRDPLVSDWLTVDQETIDRFGEATRDDDWLHLDPERARRDGPFGGTIAFGFWTLSMLTWFLRTTLGREYPEDALYGLNYGLDRVRLLAPVPVGSRIRNHLRAVDVRPKGDGRFVVKLENRVEVEGKPKPAMVAEWLIMLVYPTLV